MEEEGGVGEEERREEGGRERGEEEMWEGEGGTVHVVLQEDMMVGGISDFDCMQWRNIDGLPDTLHELLVELFTDIRMDATYFLQLLWQNEGACGNSGESRGGGA